MKKLLTLSVLTFALFAPNVMAQDDQGQRQGRGGQMFDKHDLNGDGYLSLDEFIASAKERFAKIDMDGDGKVSKEEAKKHHQVMKKKMKDMKEQRQERRNNNSSDE